MGYIVEFNISETGSLKILACHCWSCTVAFITDILKGYILIRTAGSSLGNNNVKYHQGKSVMILFMFHQQKTGNELWRLECKTKLLTIIKDLIPSKKNPWLVYMNMNAKYEWMQKHEVYIWCKYDLKIDRNK